MSPLWNEDELAMLAEVGDGNTAVTYHPLPEDTLAHFGFDPEVLPSGLRGVTRLAS